MEQWHDLMMANFGLFCFEGFGHWTCWVRWFRLVARKVNGEEAPGGG